VYALMEGQALERSSRAVSSTTDVAVTAEVVS
jgi:hypothetical protein